MNGQRHADADDKAGLQISKEEEKDRHGEDDAGDEGVEDLAQGLQNAVALAVDDLEGDAVGAVLAQGVRHGAAHVHGRGAVLLGDAELDALLAVIAADAVRLLLIEVEEGGHIVQHHGLPGGGLDGQGAEVRVGVDIAIGAQGDILGAQRDAAHRHVEVRGGDGRPYSGDG